ncbi:hypothetical protein RHSIM_RhsimUnG0136300 [Rhododendron simsii]|uniref:Peptidase C1A papain C-terminal domain-containing protein n=1 Tax=Rhododendron simsii TaxID=118357 RepID=A0A834G0R8_RHOSS|nr:hypothetical protein RHSIM_RhsimUnG0136300 [Rhododendron simsii]
MLPESSSVISWRRICVGVHGGCDLCRLSSWLGGLCAARSTGRADILKSCLQLNLNVVSLVEEKQACVLEPAAALNVGSVDKDSADHKALRKMGKRKRRKSFSWHLNDELKKKLPPVANQGNSGSCGIIAVASCTSAIYAINNNIDHPPDLSYQHALNGLLELYPDDHFVIDKKGNYGTHLEDTLNFIKKEGIGLAEHLPYQAKITQDSLPDISPRLVIDDFVVLDDIEDEANEFDNFVLLDDNTGGETITDLIMKHPICAEFRVDDGLDSHKTGVYQLKEGEEEKEGEGEGEEEKEGDEEVSIHAMMVVGFGTSRRGVDYFWCQNSYGADKNEGGLRQGCSNLPYAIWKDGEMKENDGVRAMKIILLHMKSFLVKE